MELFLSEIEIPFMCLNMIVKNESHIIKDSLTKLLNKIKIDYWVISDTGSTDNTKQIINDFFEEKKILGQLFQDEWKDFGYNRSKALEHAYSKSKYLLIFDADDEICGNFILPELTKDLYHLQFGDENGISYTRPQIINNNKKWKYVGVLHEAITCCEKMDETDTITGNYYTISGKSGARSQDPNKYLNDALILEKGYDNAFINKDEIYNRYGFYCANSYYDCGKCEEAIKWYKKTLNNNNWGQEKYVSCLRLFHCYNALKQKETGLFYLVESFLYDKERVECLYELVCHYCSNNLKDVAHCYYQVVKQFYNEKYLNCGLTDKLFLDVSKADFYLPYYMIIVCYSIKDYDTAIQMYRIIFTKKYKGTNKTFIGNLLFNLQFYIEHANNDLDFLKLFKEYISFLKSINVSVNEYDFMEKYEKYGIVIDKKCISKNKIDKNKKYETSNKILVYTGWMTHLWNESHLDKKALGGSEKAVAYLTRELPKNYDIIVSGDVEDGVFDNVTYIHENKLQSILDTTEFHTIIISRNINFLSRYDNVKCFQLLLSLHDTHILNDDQNNILNAHNNNIDKVITLTPWHKSNIITIYPNINPDKIEIINNGIDVSIFNNNSSNKIKNKFIWSSRTERGLHILLRLWGDILEKIPDATLDICCYGDFPKDDNDRKMLETINYYNKSIIYHGKLNSIELYDLMAKTDYWLYTNTFPETSCITAMEMLMNEVICLYYPLAGLNDTVGEYGIPVNRGEEIETILNLSAEKKALMREKGKEYALSCSWKNRAEEWSTMLGLNKKKWAFYCSPHFETKMIQQYIDNLNYIYPEYFIYLTNDKNRILTEKPSKITFVYEIFDTDIIKSLPNTQFSFLNTESLNIPVRLEPIINILKLYPNLEYYDYSKSNLKILEENEINIQDKIYLPYKCSDEELKKLINFNKNTKKEFDFGILKALGRDVTDRRLKIVNFLIERNFTVNIIEGWDDDRDKELAKCKTILNIHGNIGNTISYIFEHIRCDRLLESGFNILSETSYKLNIEFINKNQHLKFIDYNEFFNIDTIINFYNNKLGTIADNNYVLNILQDTHTRFNIPNEHINFLEKISKDFYPENMIIYDIGSNVLHWTQNASKIWKNSKIYLFDGMTEMKLFYDEYNKQNNTNYDYNVGVLCDEDYKRISFYQNDELSGGNSYYKEIGHPNSANIFTENHIKHKIGMKLESVVKNKNIPMPDLIKIDVQGAELDILKGSMSIINKAKFLIVELQHTEYNQGAPLCNQTRDFLIEYGWQVYAEKFSNNGPDADWCFINTRYNDINNHIESNSKQTIKKIYDTLCLNKNPFDYYLNPIDIYEHLPTLYKYAFECNSVLECGVRDSVSSWALVYGLINNNSNNKKMILNDIDKCDISKLLEYTKSISHLNVSYEWVSDLDLDLKENVDLTFIDSWHVGGHLKKELAKFSKLTNKYIIMHDTTIDEFTSEAIRAQLSEERIQKLAIDSSMSVHDVKMGLWTAIEDFLKNNSDWVLHERFTNNNGLTILKKSLY